MISKLEFIHLIFSSKKETPIEVESEVHGFCLETVNGIVEQLKKSQYYLTNPKLDFLTDILKRLIKERQNGRGQF